MQRTNVKKNCAIVLLVDSVVAQDLVVESLRGSHGTWHDDGEMMVLKRRGEKKGRRGEKKKKEV